MGRNSQKVVSVRLPRITHDLLMERSKIEDMSTSALIRNILIGFLRANKEELEKIKCYGASKSRQLAKYIEENESSI